jgi:hypothetical protein
LRFSPTYVEYNLDYGFGGDVYDFSGPYGFPVDQAVHVIDGAFSYDLSSMLKGLSITWDTDAAYAENGNQGQQFNNPYFSSRVYLRYAF